MEGRFLRKKFNIWLCLLLICGLFFIGLYIFLSIVDPQATVGIVTFFIFGLLICSIVIPSWLFNRDAFIRMDDTSIEAKYHWFGKIHCQFSDVDFALARVNTLIVQLKDGKCHTIMGVENSWALSSVIRRKMDFEGTEPPEKLIRELTDLKNAKKQGLIYTCIGLIGMFINPFITVFLTDGRELHEFTATDWKIFAIMGAIEIVTVIVSFRFAERTGRNNVPIEKTQYAIRRTRMETQSLLPGNVIKVYTDENYTGRITIFGYPNDESVYYVIQEIAPDFTLFQSYESEMFENVGQCNDGFGALIDITEKFLC